jgi:hypothetical protein
VPGIVALWKERSMKAEHRAGELQAAEGQLRRVE